MSKVAAIQMTSTANVAENLQTAKRLIEKAAAQGAKLIVLPEMFPVMGVQETDKLKVKEPLEDGPIQNFLAEQARLRKIWLVGGTIPLMSPDSNRVYSACLLFNDRGEIVARYDKMHLFDVVISEKETYQESNTVFPGDAITVINTPFGKLGLVVCYDIRFPELFRVMFNRGAEIFAIPAAFTVKTGEAHWELLARARAVESFSYVIGACQTGKHANGRSTYGHSLIVDPWGIVQVSLPEGEGVIVADIDLDYLHQIRKNIPVGEHQRILK